MRFKLRRLIQSVFVLTIVSAMNGYVATGSNCSFVPIGTVQDEQTFEDYIIRTYRRGKGSFEIIRNDERVYATHGYSFQIRSYREGDRPENSKSIGADITGDGNPNLVVSEWTGGTHCCFHLHVFEIGESFRYIQTIRAGHSELADFKNVNGDAALEFPVADWTFVYWRTCFSTSPAPRVVLKYDGRKYTMAQELMRKPPLEQDELIEAVKKIKGYFDRDEGEPDYLLWTRMLELIYAGNMDQAWTLARLSWPAGIDGREEFLKDFKEQLRKSRFWEEIKEMNRG